MTLYETAIVEALGRCKTNKNLDQLTLDFVATTLLTELWLSGAQTDKRRYYQAINRIKRQGYLPRLSIKDENRLASEANTTQEAQS